MRKILLSILAVVGLLVAGVLGFAATKPDTFAVERSASIQAPPEKVYPLIEDFRRWAAWSPFEKLDPAMKKTYSGAESGVGAVYAWEGDDHAGVGRMEITEALAPSKLALKLDFVKPMEASNVVEFTLEPAGGATKVTWKMAGPQPYVSKVMCTFFDMDKMIGTEFETGLASLKALAEK